MASQFVIAQMIGKARRVDFSDFMETVDMARHMTVFSASVDCNDTIGLLTQSAPLVKAVPFIHGLVSPFCSPSTISFKSTPVLVFVHSTRLWKSVRPIS
jgi:hypothetical protein